jgi:hypothetical protein
VNETAKAMQPGGQLEELNPNPPLLDRAARAAEGFFPGMVEGGLAQITRPKESIPGGIADVLEGAGKTALPFMAPALAMNPVATATGSLIGTGAQAAGEKGAEALHLSPDATRLTGDITGAAAVPVAAAGGGKLLQMAGRPLVKTALRLPGKAEAYGATPAKAVLEETGWHVRPAAIAASARSKIGELGKELESKAAAATEQPSLGPARQVLSGRSAVAARANSTSTPSELAPMQKFLTEPEPGFSGATNYPAGAHTPINIRPTAIPGSYLTTSQLVRGAAPPLEISERQPAPQFLGMKRQFDTDFIRNWNPAVATKGRLGAAREAYGALASEFNRAVPGAEPLNQRIASLIPAAQRARLTDLNAGLGERILSRMSRPTGGMLPALLGYHEGGIPGAALGMVGAEGAASPVPLMMGARGLYGAGSALSSPLGMGAAAGLPLVRRREEQPR